MKKLLLTVLLLLFPLQVWATVLDTTKTKLLCHFNGANGATSYTSDDANARTATFVNSAQLSTAQKVFGTASLLLASATSDYITFPSADYLSSSSDFTIGFRFRTPTDTSSYGRQGLLYFQCDANNWLIISNSNSQILFDIGAGGVDQFNWFGSISLNAWHLIEICYVASTNYLYLFIDGSLISSWNTWTMLTWSNCQVVIGYDSYFFNGYIDELYIIKGQALHTSSYTPETSEYSLSAIKTINGLTKSSVKTWNGLAIASVKSLNGLQ